MLKLYSLETHILEVILNHLVWVVIGILTLDENKCSQTYDMMICVYAFVCICVCVCLSLCFKSFIFRTS